MVCSPLKMCYIGIGHSYLSIYLKLKKLGARHRCTSRGGKEGHGLPDIRNLPYIPFFNCHTLPSACVLLIMHGTWKSQRNEFLHAYLSLFMTTTKKVTIQSGVLFKIFSKNWKIEKRLLLLIAPTTRWRNVNDFLSNKWSSLT